MLSFTALAQSRDGQQSKPAKVKLNAAVLYRQAIEELQRALPVPDYEGDIDLPDDRHEVGGPDYNSKAWRETVRKAAVAITLFEQACQIPTCKFDKKADGLTTEFISHAAHFSSLRHTVAAHAWQRVEKDPRSAGSTAMQLLQHAKHCSQEPFMIALAIGFDTEQRATKLLQAALKQLAMHEDAKVVAGRFLRQLEQHQAERPSRVTLADVTERELAFVLENGLEDALKNPAMKTACKRATQIHREITLPLREDPTVSVAAMKAHSKKHIARLKKLTKANKVAAILKNGKGETLAAMLVLLCSTDASRFLEPCLKAEEALEACRVELHKLAGK
jgi:rubrerythrin